MRLGGFAGDIVPREAADSPILVDGDGGWVFVAGVTGDGSQGNPYVIKDKVIDAGGSGSCIRIQNTTKFFVVRNCTLTNAGAKPASSIYLWNVSHGILERNNCSKNLGNGILNWYVSNVTIRENNVTECDYAIGLLWCVNVTLAKNNASLCTTTGIQVDTNSSNVIVENNTVTNNDFGIVISQNSTLTTVRNNLVTTHAFIGIYIYQARNNTVINNQVSACSTGGIYLADNSHNNTMENNLVVTNPGYGIFLTGACKNNTISRNNVTSNSLYGMEIQAACDGNLIYMNRLVQNTAGNGFDAGAFNAWDNGSRGNYWHNYTGMDGNDDGIGDSAWPIPGPAGSQDRYPLWDDGDNPILINGDAGWVAFRAAGNCTGSGTAGDPYRIVGKQINATTSTSNIWIENSTCYFTIQGCTLTNPGIIPHAAIRIANATNGLITGNNCTAGSLGSGILLGGFSTNITIEDNSVTTCGYGIVMWQQCDNITVTRNIVSANLNTGITVSNVTWAVVENNTATWNGNAGIQVVQTSGNASVRGNLVAWNTQWGVVLSASVRDNTVEGNNVTGNFKVGVVLAGGAPVEDNTIKNNHVADNQWNGILLESGATNNLFTGNNITGNGMSGANLSTFCSGNWFLGNNFSSNAIHNAQDDGTGNHWYNDSRGNYWADYMGADPDDDGVGNTPYAITGTASAQDNYPTWDDGDDVAPVITSTGFIDNQLCGPAAPGVTLAITEAYSISTAWVSYDGGAHNWTCGVAGNLPGWALLANGTVTATFWANDTAGHMAIGVSITIRKDSLAPLVTVMQPVTGVSYIDAPTFSLTIEDAQFQAAWYTLGSDPTKYFFTGSTGTIDAAAWAALPAGEVTITFHANDTLGNEQSYLVTVAKEAGDDNGWIWGFGIGAAAVVTIAVGITIKKRKGKRTTPTSINAQQNKFQI